MPRQIVYVSSATHKMDADELSDLLASCRRNNRSENLTGILLYKEGSFMQVIEGLGHLVSQMYERLLTDERHSDVTMLMEHSVEERDFPNWPMAFKGLGQLDDTSVSGSSGAGSVDDILAHLSARSTLARHAVRSFMQIGANSDYEDAHPL